MKGKTIYLIPPLLFIMLYIPSFGVVPFRDGNIDFIQSYHFYSGGFSHYLEYWKSVHPPLKVLILAFLYSFGGINAFTYSFLGLLLGIGGIMGFYAINSKLFNKKVGMMSSFFLALSPLYIANALFAQTDFIITNFLILALYFYSQKRNFWYVFFSSCAVLTKETAIILPLIVIGIESIYAVPQYLKRKSLKDFFSLLWYFIPILIFFVWIFFLDSYNAQVWQEGGPVRNTPSSTLLTVFFAPFLNIYTVFHWLQLFILNFNWVWWIIIVYGSIIFFKKYSLKTCLHLIIKPTIKLKVVIISTVFFCIYLVTVLNFPTFTIPRYALPLIPYMLSGVSVVIAYSFRRFFLLRVVIFSLLCMLEIIALYTSLDPLSRFIWGNTMYYNQNLYNLPEHLAGADGITYNLQYQSILRKRSSLIFSLKPSPSQKACKHLFPDPTIDSQTIRILHLKTFLRCANSK